MDGTIYQLQAVPRVASASAGLQDPATGEPARVEDLFDLASLAKLWVATLAAVLPNTISDVRLLRGDGRVDWCEGVELSFDDGRRVTVVNSDELMVTTEARESQ